MAYTKAVQQEIYRSAVARVQGEGASYDHDATLARLIDRYEPRTFAETSRLAILLGRAEQAVELGRRMNESPGVRPRETSYGALSIAYAGQERYEYLVIARSGGQAGWNDYRGAFVVQSATRMTAQEAFDAAADMMAQLRAGDTYFKRRDQAPGPLQFDLASAQRYTS